MWAYKERLLRRREPQSGCVGGDTQLKKKWAYKQRLMWLSYQLQHILHNNIQLIQTSHLHQQFRKLCLFHLCLGKNSTSKHDCDSRHFQPPLCHRTVDDHLFPHDQTWDAKETRGEWWTSSVSQQNDNKWGEEMGKREYKSQYSTEPKLSHGTRWPVRLRIDVLTIAGYEVFCNLNWW